MTTQELAPFVRGLRDSHALDAVQWQQLAEHARSGPADPESLGQELLRRGWMTAYQVHEVRRGRGGRLVLGPYLVLERLGHGSMGEVLKARHRHLDRLVALKVVRGDRPRSPRVRARFCREVRSAARLDHPNVVRAYDAGILGDALFLAMEYLEGTDLKRMVRRGGPLPVGLACSYAAQAAAGLQHAFERQVVHRDVKPSNLLLTARDGVVKLLDLGLARLEDEGGDLTGSRTVLGSANWLAPEQIEDPRAADVRADLYALGCTLYFLLTGAPPFGDRGVVQRMMAHLHEEAPPVEALRPGVPGELARLVRRLMAKRPDDRHQTPVELGLHLEDLWRRGVVAGGA
jgi:serine/threonine protein kinase